MRSREREADLRKINEYIEITTRTMFEQVTGEAEWHPGIPQDREGSKQPMITEAHTGIHAARKGEPAQVLTTSIYLFTKILK